MTNISFFISNLSTGGAEGVCVNLANELSKKGIAIELIVCNLNNSPLQNRLSEHVKLTNFRKATVKECLFLAIKHILISKPKVIITFGYEPSVLMILANLITLKRSKIIARNVNTISHVMSAAESVKAKALKHALKFFYPLADFHINQSKNMEDDLLKTFAINPCKSAVINNPVSRIIEDGAKTILLVDEHPSPYILCVGRLESQKRFDVAIEAFAKIAAIKNDICLHIVGDGSQKKLLEELSLKLGVAHRVKFLGQQQNVVPQFLNARLTLLTSDYEGFPNVLVESITLGTPVISLDCDSGPSEIIIDGENGFLIKNKEELPAAIIKALNEPISRERTMQSARRFSNEKIVCDYFNTIKQLYGGKV